MVMEALKTFNVFVKLHINHISISHARFFGYVSIVLYLELT